MYRKKVVVAMITYNHEKYVKQCLEGIFSQKYNGKLELVIFDDASTDRTREIIEETIHEWDRKHKYKITRYYNAYNLGPDIAPIYRSQMYKNFDGEFFCRIEGDDYWTTPFFIKKHMKFLTANKEFLMSFSKMNLLFEESGETFIHPEQQELSEWGGVRYITDEQLSKYNPIGSVNNCFYRQVTYNQYPIELVYIATGDWLTHFVISWSGKIGFLDEVLSTYRIHSKGMWSGRSEEERRNPKLKIIKFFAYILKSKPGKYDENLIMYLDRFYPERTIALTVADVIEFVQPVINDI
ncbi:glycosyltransferase involved in cell wall biosynthesis [Lachnospiraceae bacterium PFB1-21]